MASQGARVTRRTAIAVAVLVAAAVGLLAPNVGLLAAFGQEPEPAAVVKLERDWRDALVRGAKSNPGAVFENLSREEVNERLDRAARSQGFTVESVEFLQPAGLAPLITIKTSHPERLRVPELLRSIDPRQYSSDSRKGWAFEGIFLKFLDARDEPFLIVYNHWRDEEAGGGYWAPNEENAPFPHG
jgi:hypothetical protein